MPENSKYGQAHGKRFQGLTERAQIALSHYDWPGNVRELENVFSSAAISASGAFIDVGDFPVVNEDTPKQGRAGLREGRTQLCPRQTAGATDA